MVSAVTRKFVFVFYLHRERCGLLVRLSQLPRKRTPFPNNLVPGIHLVHFGAFAANGSCGYWSAGVIHARISVTSGRSVRGGNRTSGRIGRKGSDRVKRGYVRPCHFRGGNVCGG